MANKSVLLDKNKGFIIPEKAYESVLKVLQPNLIGYAICADKEVLVHRGDIYSAKDFIELQNSFKENRIIFQLGNFPRPVNEADLQPYILVGEKDKEELVMFVDGDLIAYQKPKQTDTSETRFVDEFVRKELLKEFGESATDDTTMGEFLEFLDKHEKRIVAALQGRGIVTFVSNTDEVKSFENNQLGAKFDWGYMSQTNGYSEGEFPVKEEEVSPARAKLNKWGKASTATTTTEVEKKTENKPSVPVVKTDTSNKFVPNPQEQRVSVRAANKCSNNEKKTFYNKLLGQPIHNAKERPWVEASIIACAKVPAHWLEFKDKMGEALFNNRGKVVEAAKDIAGTEPIGLKTPVTGEEKPIVVPPKQFADFQEKFLKSKEIKSTMEGVQTIPTLDEIKKDEERVTFSDKTGIPIMSTSKWPPHKRREFTRDYPDLAELWGTEWMNLALKQAHVAQATEKKEEPLPAPAKPNKWAKAS